MNCEESKNFPPESPLPGYPRIYLGPDFTIGMSAYGNSATTREALLALFLSVEGEYELILVDDCSTDSTLELFCEAADHHKNTKIFAFEKNLEYSGSLNAILSHSTGQYVLFISNDIFVSPAYIATLLEVVQHSEDFGIVRGCSNFVDNGKELYNVCRDTCLDTIEKNFSFAAEIRERCRYELADDDFLTGDAFLISRKLLDRIGGLDPIFYGYFCDHDLGVRARQAGFSPVLARGAFACHRHTANFDYLPEAEKQAKTNRRWGRVYENWARFKLKYGMPVELLYSGVRNIPWVDITQSSSQVFQPLGDYSEQCIYAPDNADVYSANLAKRAKVFYYGASLADGEKLCRWGLQHYENNPDILASLATIRTYQNRVDEAIDLFRLALSGKVKDVKTYSSLLLAMNYSEKYSQKDIYEESCRWNATFGSPKKRKPAARYDHSVIRIGFVSGDFRRHSVSYFLEPLLENIDKSRFKLYCYSDVDSPDCVTEKFRKLSDVWHDISARDDKDVADLIRGDEIDILIDLAGHSGKRIRLPVFCQRPAPVQVSWLGYPNTTGLSAIQYRITDDVTDPPGISDELHTEKLIRLPGGFLCYKPPADSPDIALPPLLRNGFVTFGSFNMIAKLSPTTILMWAKIMRRVKDSRLLLKCHYYSDSVTVERIRKCFRDFGIQDDRIELRPATVGYYQHLEGYNEVDIALDTFPYNGTTTTCEALWMGVPVVTLCGERHAGRVGASIFAMLGNEEFANETVDAYIAFACRIAREPELLGKMRSSLRSKFVHSTLCSEVGFVKNMESFFNTVLTNDIPN